MCVCVCVENRYTLHSKKITQIGDSGGIAIKPKTVENKNKKLSRFHSPGCDGGGGGGGGGGGDGGGGFWSSGRWSVECV